MRLILAPKPMEGIEEKLLKSWDRKSGQNTSENHENEKHCSKDRRWLNPKAQLYWCESRVYKVWKPPKHPPTLWKIGEISHFSPLFSKTWSTPTPSKTHFKSSNDLQTTWRVARLYTVNTPELLDHHIRHYFPQVIFVTVLEFFIKHKVQTEF
jgi:hypothetical protein